jgi:hypothetical protein
MKIILIFFLIASIVSCKSPTAQNDNNIITTTDSSINSFQKKKQTVVSTSKTHLRDTTNVSGNFIIFLRPDDTRFDNYAKDNEGGIYEVDSDFGFGLQATIDTISKNKIYKDVKVLVSTERYIIIKDCKTGPITIDRDTINYGIIMSSKGKEIMKEYNQIYSIDYTQEINDYFHIKK